MSERDAMNAASEQIKRVIGNIEMSADPLLAVLLRDDNRSRETTMLDAEFLEVWTHSFAVEVHKCLCGGADEITALKRERDGSYTCPDCGPHARVDEDACCSVCGADCVGVVGYLDAIDDLKRDLASMAAADAKLSLPK